MFLKHSINTTFLSGYYLQKNDYISLDQYKITVINCKIIKVIRGMYSEKNLTVENILKSFVAFSKNNLALKLTHITKEL